MSSVASSRRPIPLERRADLVAATVDFQGTAWWVVKDPIALQYQRLRDSEYQALQLLDGSRSLEELRDELRRTCPTQRFTLTELQSMVTELHRQQLVRSNRLGQGYVVGFDARRDAWSRFRQSLLNPLSITLPGIDPQRMLDRLLPLVGWLFHPAAVAVVLLFIAAAMGWLGVHFDRFRAQLPEFQQFFGWPNVVWLWVVLGGAKIVHEFGHGLACRKYGAECHQMGMMLLVFSPCLFCDVTDSWRLRSKWQRIAIGAAGMYVEAILSAVAVVLWWNTSDGLIHHLCLDLFFVTAVTTVVFNANPLMRFDGYYMLSDFLEIPNLRQQSEALLRDAFLQTCLGIEPRPDPFAPDRGRAAFVAFAIAAWVYRWIVVFGVLYFLCTVLKPYGVQSIGMTAAVLSAMGMAVSLGMSIQRVVTAPREERVNRRRLGVSLAVLALIGAIVLFVPLPLFVEADFVIEPERIEHVYVTVPGTMAEQKSRAGETVHRGDVVAVLANPEKEDRRRELAVERSAQEKQRRVQRALGDSGQLALVEARIATLTSQLTDLDGQIAQLVLVAPCDGKIIAPERLPEPKLDTSREQVGGWHGTPLDPPNRGSWLETRTHVFSITPGEGWQAALLVDQAARDVLEPGQSVSLKLEHRPAETLIGTIGEVSQREEQFAPQGLSQKQGGPLPTTTDSSGREKLTSPAYRAIVRLEGPFHDMPAGLRGKAHVARHESAASWLWRTLRQTLHFRL